MLIRAELILHVAHSNNIDANVEYRLVWCPYVTSGSDEVEYLFAVALGISVSDIKTCLSWHQTATVMVSMHAFEQ